MEKQQAKAPLPHDPDRMQKDVDEFPQFAEDTATGHAAWLDWPWKLHRIKGTTYELYHLEDDPEESADLADSPKHQEKLNQMQSELHAWMQSVIRSLNGADYQN